MSASEDRNQAANACTDEDRRAHTLLRLLSPLVHRLNNSLAVVQGVHELGAQASESERELARRGLAHLGQVFVRLALLSRPPAARPELVELDALLRAQDLMLAPLAKSLGVELVLHAQGTAGLEVDGRFEGLLLAACSALLASGGTQPGRRLFLVARTTPRGFLLALGTNGCTRSCAELAALQAFAQELGWRQRLRCTPGACVLRLTLSGATVAHSTLGPLGARRARRVLLLHGADVERELVSILLRENGWTVSESAGEPHTGAFDLALVERRLALEDPSLPARVHARFALERVELLEPRMRPGALLALLGG